MNQNENKELILHIGHPKTGTTTLQQTFKKLNSVSKQKKIVKVLPNLTILNGSVVFNFLIL